MKHPRAGKVCKCEHSKKIHERDQTGLSIGPCRAVMRVTAAKTEMCQCPAFKAAEGKR